MHAREVADRQLARRAFIDELVERGRQDIAAGAQRNEVRVRFLTEARELDAAAERYHDRAVSDSSHAARWLAQAEDRQAAAALLRQAALQVAL